MDTEQSGAAVGLKSAVIVILTEIRFLARIPFELLDVALLDLLHEALTLEDVTTKIGGKLPRHHENLIMRDF